MVNGNYVLYGDRPSSESEIVDDHVQTRTAERKNKRKSNRNANELQRTLNMAQLDNETDSVKYEKKIKEPRLLRYVPTSEVEENYVTEKFETYDLKPTPEERPKRYAFQKKPKNPADGSVNYAYSRSSSSCSSPNGNLPTISEHGEQYGTYRVVQPSPGPKNTGMDVFENKLDRYFYKSEEKKPKGFPSKGSHPDSLYRVQADSASGADRMVRVLRILRWPAALVTVCVVLALFVYFLMPDNLQMADDDVNGTYWADGAGAHTHLKHKNHRHHQHHTTKPVVTKMHNPGTQTSEIDFYDAETGFTTAIDSITEPTSHRVLPIKPVFPSHITPEVQYGNERADAEKQRTPKVLEEGSTLPDDSTLKPHITQKPEKPLAIYFKDLNEATTTIETISRAETGNEFANYGDKTTKKVEVSTKSHPAAYKDHHTPLLKAKPLNVKQYLFTEPEISKPPELQEYLGAFENFQANFTSGHSNLFGLSIEDAERMKSTTQNSLYNTRVSPTLPTWRDGDDTTTKNYPVNVNFEVPQCHSTQLPLCSGILPYDLAGPPVTFSGHDLTSLLPQIEYLVAANCSQRARHFACALLEPECNPPPYPRRMPCFSLCKAVLDGCEGTIPRQLTPAFNCLQYTRTNCVAARSPCFDREFTCGDGSCIPRDWICDGTNDCPSGEDESSCSTCAKNEFRCSSGGCILKRWVCDGYGDCANHEDEENCDRSRADSGEPGEESAGSAPAPAVRPYKLPLTRARYYPKSGENDSSKELLVTSDSGNALKRNFTRRPSPSRLTPYTRSTSKPVSMETITDFESFKTPKTENIETTEKPRETVDPLEDPNTRALFENLRMRDRKQFTKFVLGLTPKPVKPKAEVVVRQTTLSSNTYVLDKSINRLEKVINGAALLQKAQEAEDEMDISDTNSTSAENTDKFDEISLIANKDPKAKNDASNVRAKGMTTPHRVHSPCPTGELRCVDGRCITLAQLCDGTIDCTDHADEDNCYT